MKLRTIILCLFASLGLSSMADNQLLEGFEYGNASSPTGKEWQSPEQLSYNKLQPRANFASFATVEEARKFLPENSSYRMSLDGEWKFHFSKNPDERPVDFYKTSYSTQNWDNIKVPGSWNMQGLQKDGSLKYGVPIYVNQWVIFKYNIAVDDWRLGVMREPPKNYTTYKYRNEVGSYKRTFTIPNHWDGREVFVSFDGVDSFFYLWINGQYVGFSKNSRDAARFDISPYIHAGKNDIAVEVYRSSDGSFLEAQDMFRLPGIFRSVAVYATPKVHIQNIVVKPTFKNGKGALNIVTTVENLNKKAAKNYNISYQLYENKLFGDENKLVSTMLASQPMNLKSGTCMSVNNDFEFNNIKPWTPEEPNVYVLVALLKDKKNKVAEVVSVQTGFRTVEIKDTPASADEFNMAGRYFYINDQPLKLKGVNRHDTNPTTGHAIPREQMFQEIMMMKRANINHVRTSHYPNDPYFYYLCNKYGIVLESEANIESHEYFYGKESLSHPKEWRKAHVARVMEMIQSFINEPSIAIWSLGNEAGPGKNFVAAYQALKSVDQTRPVQYERNNDIVDMGSNQYPSIDWVRTAVKGKMNIKYPFHISEYAHSMGNAVGNLQDYWDAIESSNYFMGGAIWDWIDQSMYNYTKDGQRYLAYGGDFGDTPNDGQFVMNGIIFGDMKPKPQYFEVKKVYQNVGITWANQQDGTLDIFNKNYYTDDLTDYEVHWSLSADGIRVKKGVLPLGSVLPRQHKTVRIDGLCDALDSGKDYRLDVSFKLKADKPWAKAGYVQADQQLELHKAITRPSLASTMDKSLQPLKVMQQESKITVTGNGNTIVFDKSTGSLHSLVYGGKTIIAAGNGPKLDAFRAWVNNDNWAYQAWYENGLHNLQHKALDCKWVSNRDGSVSLSFKVESQGLSTAKLEGADKNWKKLVETGKRPDFKFTTNVIYTVYPDGSVESQSSITSNKTQLILPRLGYVMKLPADMSMMVYNGRGPIGNYPDRKTAQHIGIYEQQDVADEFVNFPKPQDMANHNDSRWVALQGEDGRSVIFATTATNNMSFSALPYSAQQLAMANHPHELPQSDGIYLHLDLAITGLGGNSCGQGAPLVEDRVKAVPHTFGYVIRPVSDMRSTTLNAAGMVSSSSEVPLSITRDNTGQVTIKGQQGHTVYYQLNGKNKTMKYDGPFNLRNGGKVNAWQKESNFKYEESFDKIETIPVTVSFASSVESGEGDAEHLIDGNPNTYWHTMYSVTVANYPHWFELDGGAVKTMTGFTYLPRQDSWNGLVKDYRVEVSQDGKTWTQIGSDGTFPKTKALQRVMFNKPVKARYLRFTALHSHDGQDFATCAEFTILN